jgi:protein TonB
MDYGSEQRDPRKHLLGIAGVIALHVIIVYALVNGLAQKVVDVIKKPLETKIIEEVKAPPPPPEIKLPPPPKLAAPPPPFIPPPEIQVQAPKQEPVIAATSSVKPAAPQTIAPQTIAPPAPAAPPEPKRVSVKVACPNVDVVQKKLSIAFDRIADKEGINTGEVFVEFLVDASGAVKDAQIIRSTHKALNPLALAGVQALRCVSQGADVHVILPMAFQAD